MEGEDRTQSYSRARSSTKKSLKAKMKSTAQLEVHTSYTSVCWETTQYCIQICWIDGQCDRTFCILFGSTIWFHYLYVFVSELLP